MGRSDTLFCLRRAQRDFIFPRHGNLAHADGLAVISEPRQTILRNVDRRILSQRQNFERDAFFKYLRRESAQADLPRTTEIKIVVDELVADAGAGDAASVVDLKKGLIQPVML
ncbi:MAG: hypothetical protein JO295_00065 [Verrucomicrobia bacterium]|nr:hypothetical protein [Verrucomicrobiota bacterium]